MKKTNLMKILLFAFCLLFFSATSYAQEQEDVSWEIDNMSYTLSRRPSGEIFHNRTTVTVVRQADVANHLSFYAGPLEDDLLAFGFSLCEAELYGNEYFWNKDFDTSHAAIYFSDISDWGLTEGEYILSVAAKTWGEDAAVDLYDLHVSHNSGNSGGDNSGNITDEEISSRPDIDTTPSDIIIKPDAAPEIIVTPDAPSEEVEISVEKVKIKSVSRKSTKKAKLTWKKLSNKKVTYEISYSTNKDFKKKYTKTVTTKKTTYTLKNLKNKKYYVRIRAFVKSDGEKVYGKYSKTYTLKKYKK